ncbi:hypothetical protein HJG60_009787 [Phyllostomus discolor]|uniref:Uncharacterized protein n=1 Tax=Phyllostomus discolor TaxID=89673 RepID=A0A834B3C2_9CHIR|nr:hypothetical protein HJG60_009787 [Phyllostomus discolor]
MGGCMGYSSYWSPLGVWLTWVALPAWQLDWSLYLGMALFACLSSENSGNLANKLGSVQSMTPGKVYYLVLLSISCFSPQAVSIVTETEIAALALHTAHALNDSRYSKSLLNEEMYQLRKVVLQNRMALDMLTASQCGVCALVGAECCVYVPDVPHNVSQALQVLASEIRAIESLTGDPLREWWASLTTEWWWVLTVLGGSTCVLLACCCSLYCCCELWVQGSAFLTKGPCGRQPHIDCKMRNTKGVNCRVSRGSLASLPRCLGN